jgi:hypothetical protein
MDFARDPEKAAMFDRIRLTLFILAALLGLCAAIPVAVADDRLTAANTTALGPNVYVFDPGMPAAEIGRIASQVFTKMEANQFGRERYALLFKPGTYDVTFNVGFYTHVAGLGLSPDDVHIRGGVNVNAKWMPNGNATCNFWRTLENFAVTPSTTGGITRIAVSQAAPLRRLHIKGELQLFDFNSRGNAGWASGGFLADSVVDGKVVPASQQQWLARNSTWASWQNAVWNMVFVGCTNEPSGEFPNPAYTVVQRTPIIREKPYLTIDASDRFCVFVPALQARTKGVSWASGHTPGKTISLDQFYIAQPDSADAPVINAALAAGKHILFTPGVYQLEESLRVTRADTIVIGLGIPSLIPTNSQPAISVADVDGVTIAGLIVDAGAVKSASLVEIGPQGSTADHSANPTFLYDLTVRTGGPAAGRNDVGLVINSRNVVADQIWIWRADHGAGASWRVNPTRNGLVVTGDDVTIYGLFNEHHQGYQTLWNGNAGRVYMYQSEMPYDVPNQSSWLSGKMPGFASYKVADTVNRHEAWGIGVYCYFRDAAVKAQSAIEAPAVPGVELHNLTTVWLNGRRGSEITHIVNDFGGRVHANSPAGAMRQTLREFSGKSANSAR